MTYTVMLAIVVKLFGNRPKLLSRIVARDAPDVQERNDIGQTKLPYLKFLDGSGPGFDCKFCFNIDPGLFDLWSPLAQYFLPFTITTSYQVSCSTLFRLVLLSNVPITHFSGKCGALPFVQLVFGFPCKRHSFGTITSLLVGHIGCGESFQALW